MHSTEAEGCGFMENLGVADGVCRENLGSTPHREGRRKP